jgi:hypothetical protein
MSDTASNPNQHLTPEQVATAVAGFRANGMPEDQIAAAFGSEAGFTAPGQTAPADKRTEDAKAIDAFAPPVTDPRAYDVGGFSRNAVVPEALAAELGANNAAAAQPALDREVRAGFSAMGIPATVAKSLSEMMSDSATRFARITDPAARALEHQSARFQLTQALGENAVAEAAAAFAKWRAKAPKVVDAMTEAGYFTNPMVLGQLALQTRRAKARG